MAQDLCSTISTILQFLEETVYSFAMRCLKIRQKILLFSGKPDNLNYTPQLVNKRFLKTLKKETRSPFIVQKIKHLLKADDVCDEDLLVVSSCNGGIYL